MASTLGLREREHLADARTSRMRRRKGNGNELEWFSQKLTAFKMFRLFNFPSRERRNVYTHGSVNALSPSWRCFNCSTGSHPWTDIYTSNLASCGLPTASLPKQEERVLRTLRVSDDMSIILSYYNIILVWSWCWVLNLRPIQKCCHQLNNKLISRPIYNSYTASSFVLS